MFFEREAIRQVKELIKTNKLHDADIDIDYRRGSADIRLTFDLKEYSTAKQREMARERKDRDG